MADRISPEKRSWNMSRIGSRDTKPELRVRSALHRMGYRFRVHRKDLPGKPDVALPGLSTAIFVHGCFWHRHKGCRNATTPKTRTAFWKKKFAENTARDRKNTRALRNLGWDVVIFWECETEQASGLVKRIRSRIRRKYEDN